MTLKKFFKNTNATITNSTKQQFTVSGSEIVESYEAPKQKSDFDRKIFAFVDISASLSNYVRFGLAEYHYESGIKRVYQDYPYDGSQADKYKFLNDSNTFDYWIWKDKYPKTTGYVTLNEGTNKTQRIEVKAGPNINSVYNSSNLQSNNLAFDSAAGTTVEFWAKATTSAGSVRRGVVDLRDSSDGTFFLYSTVNGSDVAWSVQHSRSAGMEADLTFATLTSQAESWHHYAFVFESLGASSALTATLYVDGVYTQQKIDLSLT